MGLVAEWRVYCDNDPARKIMAGQSGEGWKLTAAYEVDDLEIVVWLDFCFVPLCARKDIQVVLDGDAVIAHFQKIQQGADRQAVGDFARVAVYFYDHGNYGAGVADELDDSFGRERMMKRISSFQVSALA